MNRLVWVSDGKIIDFEVNTIRRIAECVTFSIRIKSERCIRNIYLRDGDGQGLLKWSRIRQAVLTGRN